MVAYPAGIGKPLFHAKRIQLCQNGLGSSLIADAAAHVIPVHIVAAIRHN